MLITHVKRSISVLVCALVLIVASFALLSANSIALARPDRAPQATTRYVAKSGADSLGCTVSTSPCLTIQYAIDQAANSGDTIKVAQGTYNDLHAKPRKDIVSTGSVTQVVYISKSLTILGGYATGNFTVSHPLTQPTIIDAGNAGRGVYLANNASATFQDFRITRGNPIGQGGGKTTSDDAGGGLYAFGGGLNLINNRIYSNTAESGAGVFLSDTLCLFCYYNVIVTNTARNGLAMGGGVIFYNTASAVWDDNLMDSNIANEGGGLYLVNSMVTVRDNSIINNYLSSGTRNGGGVYLDNSDAAMSGNVISANIAFIGGGLVIENSAPTLANNTIANNTANTKGGGVYLDTSGGALFAGNLIRGNSGSTGGGIYVDVSPAKFTNNVIIDNKVTTEGSGVFVFNSAPRFFHTTIVHNTGGDGSGLLNKDSTPPYSNVWMTNTIFVSQTIAVTATEPNTITLRGVLFFNNGLDYFPSDVSVQNSYFGDPRFAPDGYHLWPLSAAINKGITTTVTNDIDGHLRPLDSASDLGADEFTLINETYLPIMLKNY